MSQVYLLHHLREDNESEHVKLIGVFSSVGAAEAARDAVKSKPGFRDHPDGFSIDSYEVDRRCWTEGFGID